jgi:hypothetical protein
LDFVESRIDFDILYDTTKLSRRTRLCGA